MILIKKSTIAIAVISAFMFCSFCVAQSYQAGSLPLQPCTKSDVCSANYWANQCYHDLGLPKKGRLTVAQEKCLGHAPIRACRYKYDWCEGKCTGKMETVSCDWCAKQSDSTGVKVKCRDAALEQL